MPQSTKLSLVMLQNREVCQLFKHRRSWRLLYELDLIDMILYSGHWNWKPSSALRVRRFGIAEVCTKTVLPAFSRQSFLPRAGEVSQF